MDVLEIQARLCSSCSLVGFLKCQATALCRCDLVATVAETPSELLFLEQLHFRWLEFDSWSSFDFWVDLKFYLELRLFHDSR